MKAARARAAGVGAASLGVVVGERLLTSVGYPPRAHPSLRTVGGQPPIRVNPVVGDGQPAGRWGQRARGGERGRGLGVRFEERADRREVGLTGIGIASRQLHVVDEIGGRTRGEERDGNVEQIVALVSVEIQLHRDAPSPEA